MRYGCLYVGVDSSAWSRHALAWAALLAKRQGARVVVGHVYAGALHDDRFRALEAHLPDPYRRPERLASVRRRHAEMMGAGLARLAEAQVGEAAAALEAAGVACEKRIRDGRNWAGVLAEAEACGAELVLLGACGMGHVEGAELGGVAARVLALSRRDVLICRRPPPEAGAMTVIVGLDGSRPSWRAARRAFALAGDFGAGVTLVGVYDPVLHRQVFAALSQVLSPADRSLLAGPAGTKLHEEIIDRGLAALYRRELERAVALGSSFGVPARLSLRAGKPWRALLAEAAEAALVVVGAQGLHGDDPRVLGRTTEELARRLPTNLLVVRSTAAEGK